MRVRDILQTTKKLIFLVKRILILLIILPIIVLVLSFWLVKRIYIAAPVVVVFLLGYRYTITAFSQDFPLDQYKFLLIIIGTTATFCGLILRLSSACSDKKYKEIYYESGEELFYGTLLFSFALLVKYTYFYLATVDISIFSMARQLLNILGIVLFYSALNCICAGLVAIEITLADKRKDPIYKAINSAGIMSVSTLEFVSKILGIPLGSDNLEANAFINKKKDGVSS